MKQKFHLIFIGTNKNLISHSIFDEFYQLIFTADFHPIN